jgi:hypothetical protein
MPFSLQSLLAQEPGSLCPSCLPMGVHDRLCAKQVKTQNKHSSTGLKVWFSGQKHLYLMHEIALIRRSAGAT